MKRIASVLIALVAIFTVSAQTPEAVLECISKYPNLAYPEAAIYPGAPAEGVATAPEGFEPFYFSLVGRHGSRYERSDKYFKRALGVFDKANELGILTEEGKLLHKKIKEIYDAQQGNDGELAPLGFEQWNEIGERAYKNFGKIFESGSVEAKSSISLRCVFSMASFNNAITGKVPSIKVAQHARKSDLWIIRPLANDPSFTKEEKKIIAEHKNALGTNELRKEWEKNYDASAFISKVTTDPEAFVKKCGDNAPFMIARHTIITLLFGENFGHGDREMLTRLFTPKELYGLYVHQTSNWVNSSMGRGAKAVEAYQSYMRPMAEDILNKAQAAIDGKNPDVANLRFTHDSYVGPIMSVLGYEGCVPQWNKDIELATTSFNHGTVVPMAANLQIILYRNKKGKVLVRSLINERDAYLPIKSKTAPFYPWSEFCKYVNNNLDALAKSRDNVLKKHNK